MAPRGRPRVEPSELPELEGRAGPILAYSIYGFSIASQWKLRAPFSSDARPPELSLLRGSRPLFERAVEESGLDPRHAGWFFQSPLPDGSLYLRWSGLFEFLISPDNRRIFGRPLRRGTQQAFRVYLLNQVLSFAFIRRGIEPLHATAVVSGGKAFAIIGDSGYGKSTLGAALLHSGCRLLTDDLLRLELHEGGVFAHPGPPQLKLFPATAASLLGKRGGAAAMTGVTPKLVLPLASREWCDSMAPLSAVYALAPPGGDSAHRAMDIQPLSGRGAMLALIANTFNTALTDPRRLGRQFEVAHQVAGRVPVRSLSYPRDLELLASVAERLVADATR